jgi:large subunit ribosomal protein L13e
MIISSPTHMLRPAVRGQTNKYNRKIRLGRGFTLKELRTAGITSQLYARSIGIAIDTRRKDTCNETLNTNVNRLKDYLNRIILYPRKGHYDKKPIIKEATKERLSGPDAKFQNTTKTVLPLPQPESAVSLVSITKEMTSLEAYKTLRKEWKQQKGVYKRLEAAKKKKLEKSSAKK